VQQRKRRQKAAACAGASVGAMRGDGVISTTRSQRNSSKSSMARIAAPWRQSEDARRGGNRQTSESRGANNIKRRSMWQTVAKAAAASKVGSVS